MGGSRLSCRVFLAKSSSCKRRQLKSKVKTIGPYRTGPKYPNLGYIWLPYYRNQHKNGLGYILCVGVLGPVGLAWTALYSHMPIRVHTFTLHRQEIKEVRAKPKLGAHTYLDPKSICNNSPKPPTPAQEAILLHSFGAQV